MLTIERASIVQYWHAEEPPDYIAYLLDTFRERNPDMRYMLFDERSAAEFIEERLSARHLRAFSVCAIPAMQADYFRYCAIFVLGGVYSDADAHCAAALRSLVPAAGCGRLFYRPDGYGLINALFAFGAPGHPFLELALEIATSNIERRISDSVYFTTGPPIFTCLLWLHRCGSFDRFLSQAEQKGVFPYGRTYVKAIDDYARVDRAFRGIEVSSATENVWIRAPEVHLEYKESDQHFTKAKGRIYRNP